MPQFRRLLAELPLAAQADVAVLGGGPAGVCAAVAAAQEGADVVLIERYGFLGGMATAGLVNPFMAFQTASPDAPENLKLVNGGLLQVLIQRLAAAGGYEPREQAFDPETFKHVAQEMVLEARVRLRLHTSLIGALAEEGRVRLAGLASKSGLETVAAEVFIDATGDADLAAWAGAEYEQGRPEDGLCQPMTLNFRVGGVEPDLIPAREEINARYVAAKERGEIENPRENVLWFYTTRRGEIHFNTTRVVGKQATEAGDLTAAEIESRRQVQQMVAFLQREIPGFASAYLLATATQIGMRESRRVMGDYLLTADDVLGARDFSDGIARGCYPVDIHNPAGTGTVIQAVPPGRSYAIPYRCLTPVGWENLLVAGRPISADHAAHSSLRVMPIAMNIGEAAGVAAAQSLSQRGHTRAVETENLRRRLRERGAVIDEA
jgi:glycine/D-amino acid oxidase-like deaminating enzyme